MSMTVAELREWLRTFDGCQSLPVAVTWDGQIIELNRDRVFLYPKEIDGTRYVLIDADVTP